MEKASVLFWLSLMSFSIWLIHVEQVAWVWSKNCALFCHFRSFVEWDLVTSLVLHQTLLALTYEELVKHRKRSRPFKPAVWHGNLLHKHNCCILYIRIAYNFMLPVRAQILTQRRRFPEIAIFPILGSYSAYIWIIWWQPQHFTLCMLAMAFEYQAILLLSHISNRMEAVIILQPQKLGAWIKTSHSLTWERWSRAAKTRKIDGVLLLLLRLNDGHYLQRDSTLRPPWTCILKTS